MVNQFFPSMPNHTFDIGFGHFHRIQIGSKIEYKTYELQINIRHFKTVRGSRNNNLAYFSLSQSLYTLYRFCPKFFREIFACPIEQVYPLNGITFLPKWIFFERILDFSNCGNASISETGLSLRFYRDL